MSLQNKTFNELITFARSTGGGRFNASGQYEWLAAGEPRFDFDPVTLEPRGILIEEQRTNLFTQSQDFSNAVWSKGQGVVVEEGIAAWSGNPQYRLTATAAGAFAGRIARTVGVSSASYSCGFFIKRGTANWACITIEMPDIGKGRRVWFDLVGGVVGGNVSAGASQNQWAWRAGIQKVSESEFFCWVSVDVTESGPLSSVIIAPDFNLSSTVSVGNSIFISAAQLEVGALPTSYIPTTTAQVTRAADVCSVDNLSPWYRADEFTALVEFTRGTSFVQSGGGSLSPRIVSFGTNSEGIMQLRAFSSANLEWVGPSVSGVGMYADAGTWSSSAASNKVGVAYKSMSTAAISVNGGTVGLDSTVPAYLGISLMAIGRNTTSDLAPLNGHIRRIRYIPRRVSDTELRALTAL